MAVYKKNARVSLVFWSDTAQADVETPGVIVDGPYTAIPDGSDKLMQCYDLITLERSRPENAHMTINGDGLYLRKRIVGVSSWALGPRLDPSITVAGLDDKTIDQLDSQLFAQQRAALSRRMREKSTVAVPVADTELVPF